MHRRSRSSADSPALSHYQQAREALAKADRGWLSRMITRKEPLERWREAIQARPGEVKVVITFRD